MKNKIFLFQINFWSAFYPAYLGGATRELKESGTQEKADHVNFFKTEGYSKKQSNQAKAARVEIPLKNRSRYERFERFFSKI